MTKQTDFPEIETRLEELKEIPPRDPQQTARGRSEFLNEAASYHQAVSVPQTVRQKGWTFLANRKEKLTMNALVSLFLATALILGGSATAIAAQDDLPNQPLYPIKLWAENAKLALNDDPLGQANLLMQMSQARVEEMAGLTENGIPTPAKVHKQLQEQIHQTLMLAADMKDSNLTQTLLQLRERLRTQERIMAQLQTHNVTDFDPLITQTRLMLQARLQLVDEGLADPEGFRQRMTNQKRYGHDENATPEPNQQGEPGFHQNSQSGQQPAEPGNGTSKKESNDSTGGHNPDNLQSGSGANGSGSGTPGGQNSDNSQGGNGSGSGNNGGDGTGENR